VAGTDYTPVHGSVLFADGDDSPRAVAVPILPDQLGSQRDRTVLLTLSDPGGCATLRSPATAELTIRDDDPGPPPPQPYGLDPTFGTGGKATTTAFGGDRSSMALQPDGRIVVAGYTNRDDVTVARYQRDGQLDGTFGTDGVVTGIATGIANDVTIDPDERIVIAGRATWRALAGTTSRTCSSRGSSRMGDRTRASAWADLSSPMWAGWTTRPRTWSSSRPTR
jgi:uncharacterized delta-60 repeat protein